MRISGLYICLILSCTTVLSQSKINYRLEVEESSTNCKNISLGFINDSSYVVSYSEFDSLGNFNVAIFPFDLNFDGKLFLSTTYPLSFGVDLLREDILNLYYIDFYVYKKFYFFKKYIFVRSNAVFLPGYKKKFCSTLQRIRADNILWNYWKGK